MKTLLSSLLISFLIILPIISGYASIPKNASPEEIANFLTSIIRYYFEIIRNIYNSLREMQFLQPLFLVKDDLTQREAMKV